MNPSTENNQELFCASISDKFLFNSCVLASGPAFPAKGTVPQ
jgi:hypothetical protein